MESDAEAVARRVHRRRCGRRWRRCSARSPTRSTRHRRGRSSRAAKSRSATSSRTFASKPSRQACRCESMRRKPLFPPPKDPTTGKTKRNKGRQDFTVLTINGRVRLWRRRWHSPGRGDDHAAGLLAGHRRGHDQPGRARDGLPAQRRRQELRQGGGQPGPHRPGPAQRRDAAGAGRDRGQAGAAGAAVGTTAGRTGRRRIAESTRGEDDARSTSAATG